MAKDALKNIAYERLLEQIMNCELEADAVLVEQDISDMLGISRTPVREALKQLEADGLVAHIPSRGTFVKDITVQDVEEIFQIRTLFELCALREALKFISDSELDTLEAQLSSVENASDKEAFYRTDRDLHWTILRYSHNARMIGFYNTIEIQFERLRRLSSMTPMRLSASRYEHLDIVAAMRTRDYDTTAKFLKAHLNNVKESTICVCRTLKFQKKIYP